MQRLLARLVARFEPLARRPLAMGALALLLASPALVTGLAFDDLFHRHYLLGRAPLDGDPFVPRGLFSALHGDPEDVRRLVDSGFAPWFTLPELRLSFFRPLSELTHRLDYALWPGSPWLMHLQSLAWLAALVVAATILARRVLGHGAGAGFAALLVAIDCRHATATSWIASRNSVICAALAFFALIAHDRWRRDRWKPGALLAPLLAAAALLAGEGAVALFAWLLAHALFLDARPDPSSRARAPLGRRLLALLPCAAVGVAWAAWYRGHGYGAWGSGPYVDPMGEPGRYALTAATRAPLLVLGSLLHPQIDVVMSLAPKLLLAVELVAALFTVAVAGLFAPLVRREPAVRFLALGGALSLLPICAMLPSNRLLPFVGFAAMGLLARALARRSEAAPRGRFADAFLGLLAFVALLVAPLFLPLLSLMPKLLGSSIERAVASFPSDPAVAADDFHVVATPDFFCAGMLPYVRDFEGAPRPRRVRALSFGPVPLRIARHDDRSLDLDFGPGLPADPLSQLFRGPAHPLHAGDRFPFAGWTIEVLAASPTGRATRARFSFDRPLDDPHVRWFTWSDDHFIPWSPPPFGEIATVEPARALWTPPPEE
jgi:hypothetical protein